ncbi:macro domain-containing protein [Dactylosporangium sp. AC04546]|uniref:macro domain-containing protein n=1 Tax=Dactylosporangium sp. AC04546 TaxID=2862460 RepID=UPI001EDFC4EC|nr:macro domain-containing protein [Dactylosporangium sp. AC04546]WVK88391.1 macro domain-containing protein [Dactylosporangium sp. AC04546]
MGFPTAVRMGFVVDVAGYGRRTASEQVDLQQRVAALVDEVLRDLNLRLADTHHHGTGDGMVVFLPAEVDVYRALARLPRSAAEALAGDNRRYRDRMRLRMAAVIGPLGPAAIGFSGDAIVAAGRLVDSDALRRALADRPGSDLVFAVSEQLHAYAGARPDEFRPVDVQTKEFHGRAWLWTGPAPREPRPADRPALFTLAPPHAPDCVLGIRPGRIMRVHDVDIWVNSENTDMEMARFNEFSISSIIRYNGARRDAAGHVVDDVIADALAKAVDGRRPVAPGAAFVTGSGCLAGTNAVRWIIHVAAVQGEPGAGFRQVRRVGVCVANALAQAERLAREDAEVRTILFPMLGTGGAGAPVAATAAELVDAAVFHLTATPASRLRGIYFLAFTDAERSALDQALAAHPALEPRAG